MRQLLFVVFATSVVCGCSANVFKDPVTAFDSAVTTIKATVDGYDQAASGLELKGTTFEVAPKVKTVLFDVTKCNLGKSDGCGITVETLDGKSLDLLPSSLQISGPAKGLATIKMYSADLVKVVNATTSPDLDKSVGDLSKSLANIGKTVGGGALGNVGPLATLVQFIGGNYIEYKRLQILRDAIGDADKLIQKQKPEMVKQIGEYQKQIFELNRDLIANLSDQARNTKDNSVRRALMIEAESLSADVRDFAKVDASAAALKLTDAHAALAKAVEEPSAGLQTTYEALVDFAQQAKDAYDALNKLHF